MFRLPFLSPVLWVMLLLLTSSCSEGGGVNIFTIEDDKALGTQFDAEIRNDQTTYPLLDSLDYPKVYSMLYALRDTILQSGQMHHADDFTWKIGVIGSDTVVNAFCTPGGYIYVYTGLLKFLDNESQLAGILGHEMAHADLRHSTDQLSKAYGVQFLLQLVLGDNGGMVREVVSGMTQLAFSRRDESQADAYSVQYLCGSKYAADASADFFKKMEAEGESRVPEFFSTHPNPSDRVERIRQLAYEQGCRLNETAVDGSYLKIIATLPN